MAIKAILAAFQGWRFGGTKQKGVQQAQDLKVQVEYQEKEDDAHREEESRPTEEITKDGEKVVAQSA
ncbi:MAG: hypothetical protein UT43_C0011G0008 [Parcubacteria group bacterium GW2011_GWC1_39_29]|uniref:Uncharacterized protein n=1 Tax=Candidatus Yanofskybacteria bacterium GW2011_GWD1_39_16 TaxID=1619030 RepID=A0A837HPP4_9BACT|nr:MAG: hypothetical protein UT35_C0015G0002 [Candidatus Yanofskybacteria bacterium GW2011_GWD1_39_16]KKR14966.1 MAG: hypothetical protein UT43_C0011G0008 [Parcubacteria group bacterium GW2011_GWC1_39_29]